MINYELRIWNYELTTLINSRFSTVYFMLDNCTIQHLFQSGNDHWGPNHLDDFVHELLTYLLLILMQTQNQVVV